MDSGTSDSLCQALGTTWWLELPDTLPAAKRAFIEADIINYINQFEADYSRFRLTSLISRLNDTGRLEQPSRACRELLCYGQTLYTQSDGLFNILIGTHLIQRGYDSNYSFIPHTEPSTLPNPTTDLRIEKDCITLLQGAVDIGGYGKGYLIDLVATRLNEEFHLSHFLINGGGDMYAKTELGKPVTIYLSHPHNPQLALASTTLDNEAFAASSPHIRNWSYQGKVYDHIVRPTTKPTTTPSDSVFVKAQTAALADAHATTLLLLDAKPAQVFCNTHAISAAFYYSNDAKLVSTPTFTPLQTY